MHTHTHTLAHTYTHMHTHTHTYAQGWPEPYIYRYIRCTYGILAKKSPYIRSYTVQIYGSGQPYVCSHIHAKKTRAGARACANTHPCLYKHTHTHTHSHAQFCVKHEGSVITNVIISNTCKHTYTHIPTHTCTHTHKHTHTRTYTHIRTHSFV